LKVFYQNSSKTGHKKLNFLQGFIRQPAETLFMAYTDEK
jgi:hypothetical protein